MTGAGDQEPQVRAAGGVVVRPGAAGPEVAVVHRPGYRDWSLPKGKLDPGESWEEAALREVEEEAGLVCTLGPEAGSVRYVDRKGRPKEVRYWRMEVVEDLRTVPNDEVDEVRWCTPAEARELLTYERDRELVAGAETGV